MCDPKIANLISRFKDDLGFFGCHTKELRIYERSEAVLRKYIPKIFGTYESEEKEAYVVLMERFNNLTCLDEADQLDNWNKEHVAIALQGIAEIHREFLGKNFESDEFRWLTPHAPSSANIPQMKELWSVLSDNAHNEFPLNYTPSHIDTARAIIERLEQSWIEIDQIPRTLVHNDFNPRNVALSQDSSSKKLYCYDWELCTAFIPHHDLVEFLAFTITSDWDDQEILAEIDSYRKTINQHPEYEFSPQEWLHQTRLAMDNFYVTRLSLYIMGHVS